MAELAAACSGHAGCFCGAAGPFSERGWQSLKTRNLNMFTLIAMGTGVAWLYSIAATFFLAPFPPNSV